MLKNDIEAITLETATLKNTLKFTFNMIVQAKVVKVYDGDTITCVFNTFGLGLFKHQVRLNGIDTAELKSIDPNSKSQAITARDFVSDTILNKVVKLQCEGTDKYGRILGRIFIDDVCINDILISKKLAVLYDGGKKGDFID